MSLRHRLECLVEDFERSLDDIICMSKGCEGVTVWVRNAEEYAFGQS